MAYDITWEPCGVVKRFYGFVTREELLQSLFAVESDARFDDIRYVINDFLDVEGFSVNAGDVTLVAAIDNAAARSNPRVHIAIVTVDPTAIALAQGYAESHLTVFPTAIFPSREAARAWLMPQVGAAESVVSLSAS